MHYISIRHTAGRELNGQVAPNGAATGRRTMGWVSRLLAVSRLWGFPNCRTLRSHKSGIQPMSKDTTAVVNELKAFFKDRKVAGPIMLSSAETVVDVPKFLDSHFAMASNEGDARGAEVFLQRLLKLKDAVERAGQ